MKRLPELDDRPVVVAIAGPNGAGKTTFYGAHVAPAALRFVNADVLARDLDMDPYDAAKAADKVRRALLKRGESFAFETVFSDPVGDKLAFLEECRMAGYAVVLCFIGLQGPEVCEERVAMRVSQGGHDVPSAKLKSRFPRTMENLRKAVRLLPVVYVFDNTDLGRPFHRAAVFRKGRLVEKAKDARPWVDRLAD
ncbi:MAG: hypothetical protein KGL53_12550 [Elusimicrobia bacterium]|nr:hypothetical protein [Elusimicrobiota bacterium]